MPTPGMLSPPQSAQSSYFSSASWSTSDEESSSQEEEESSSVLQSSTDAGSLLKDPLEEKVTDLVRSLMLKYRLKDSITKVEMLEVVTQNYKNEFPVIFNKASKCLQLIFGIDVKEVDPTGHSYVLANSLDLTYNEVLGDNQSMPTNGLLITILGMIFIEGNCASEESIWEFLNMMGLYAGNEHFIYGDPRKLLTVDWVQENYLEYRQVPHSDPPDYEFLWGPRAHAETSKMKVLEFLAKVKGSDPSTFSGWYEEALRDEEERARSRIDPMDRGAAIFIAQH
nr:melanoma-associated antigen 10-like [Microcebus murinus]XP_020140726.1 melanoma-associated antigen 10-like [Microcebus murinus]XP_020140727.1 melanoma-associated antigen 10-like [Microcebus murinus]XP_020140728.1 melanoma-associated antigen 10-like [Microcebus murinus]XP_020140729.1 melanoma-associated antigen 10-like [Microcebus murinus]